MNETVAIDFLLTGVRLAGVDADFESVVADGVIAAHGGLIAYAGPSATAPSFARSPDICSIEGGGLLAVPGLIDCHTHLVFAGDRSDEFARRLRGESYTDIAASGGGIQATVAATRAADWDSLLQQSLPRARSLLASGVTTLEIKSGYGLETATERRMLEVATRIGEVLGIDVYRTFLGAHALPKDCAGDRDEYLRQVTDDMLPALVEAGLVDAVDAFCESIGFSIEETARVFDAAKAAGLPVKLHADQLGDSGGTELACRYNALSADHIEYASTAAIEAMAHSGCVAVLLPGAFHMLAETKKPPIKALRDAGVPMAVATDLNPGTSPLASLTAAMNLACLLFGLTPAEALKGATLHAARALGLKDRGSLAAGLRCDIALFDAAGPAGLCYYIDGIRARRVFSAGRELPLDRG